LVCTFITIHIVLTKLEKEGKITKEQYKHLYPTSEITPRIYCPPKIHKKDNPLRPVVDYTGSITYNTARAIADLLNPMVGNTEHHIKDSKDLTDKLKNTKIKDNHILVSHDVVSLFTKVPMPEAMKVIETRIKEDTTLKDRTNLEPEDIIDLLKFVCEGTFFAFQGQIYEQIFGTPMGSPVSPVVANLFMEHLEQKVMSTCPDDIKPQFWIRYVDDIMEAIPAGKLDELTNFLNTVDETGNIKFTHEEEEQNKLPMLDVLAHRQEDGTIKTTVYRKKTHTDQYLNFDSHHPIYQRLGVARTLLDRANNIVTEKDDKTVEEKHIAEALKQNKYPKWTIKTTKQAIENKEKKTTQKNKDQEKSKGQVILPYIQGTTEKLIKIYKNYGIRSAVRPATTLRKELVHPKDKIPTEKTTGCVYKVPCINCDKVYIGETSRSLKTRINEHKDDVDKNSQTRYTRANRKSSQTEQHKSAITDHTSRENHVIDWDNVRPIVKETHTRSRQIHESIQIRKHKNNMNRDEGAYQLSKTYNWLLGHSGVLPPSHF